MSVKEKITYIKDLVLIEQSGYYNHENDVEYFKFQKEVFLPT
jgi:hypothetical protein